MKLEFDVEETVTEGLEKLQEEFQGEIEFILRELAYQATGKEEDTSAPIPSLMGRWNPWLYMSGQEESARTYEHDGGIHRVIINYSGMRYEEMYTPEEFKPWWEFAEDFESYAPEAILERDYAYFQETGRDSIADSKDAKHKYAIEWGMKAAARPIRDKLRSELETILNRL